MSYQLKDHPVVPHEQWIAARSALLAKEKEFSRLREELAEKRRQLPWEKVEKPYSFVGPGGNETLAQLFGPRSQLLVYHFMFAPESEAGCSHCSFWADHFDATEVHLKHRDVTLAVISRAPLAKLEAFKKRMGWKFKWVSSGGTDFNYDFNASFKPEDQQSGRAVYNYAPGLKGPADREGISVFYKDPSGTIFHTYSCYARGIDMMNGTYQFLDLVPKGRDEDGLKSPQAWVRYHDRYEG
jgi:predicted dithiol-disulfide oxidoreductase (DUF899 family)